MAEEGKYALSTICFRCKKPVVEMTAQEIRKRFGGAPITAIIKEHYITPWGVACPDCMKHLCGLWGQYKLFQETGDLC